MTKSPADIRTFLTAGMNVSIDGPKYSATDVRSFARHAADSGVHLMIRGAETFSSSDLRTFATAGGRNVTIELG